MNTATKISCFNNISNPIKRILFLGYGKSQTKLIDALINKNCEVHHTQDLIRDNLNYDLIISFGYRHILKKNVICGVGSPIFNLHISYLPFNRGTHPNFWSFYENTPSGVTIHLIDEGIDTGPIVYQKYVNFDNNETTFSETYNRLIVELEKLFIDNIDAILSDNWVAKPQKGQGTLHFAKDLPEEFSGWNSNIEDEIKRLNKIVGTLNE